MAGKVAGGVLIAGGGGDDSERPPLPASGKGGDSQTARQTGGEAASAFLSDTTVLGKVLIYLAT